jgi:hypothetical protein
MPITRTPARYRALHRRWLLVLLFSAIVTCLIATAGPPGPQAPSSQPPIGGNADDAEVAELRERARRVDNHDWLVSAAGSHAWLTPGVSRSELLRAKYQSQADGDALGSARAAAVLATEAQVRAARVLDRWMARIDPETGLLPRGVAAEDRVWDYANAGADLYPHLAIAATLLRPRALPALEQVLLSEQRMTEAQGLPADVDLTSDRAQDQDLEQRTYGAVEFAKDGLLPLTERLGRGPWFNRMQQLARATDTTASVPTPFGPIPSDKSEVNGQALQVLSRLYWATHDDSYRAAGERIARAYLELALPSTSLVPTRTWDFNRNRSSSRQVQLRDHGNEVVAGLVEFHLVQTLQDDPAASEHRVTLRAMLDQLLEIGRTPDGLWKSEIDLGTGRARSYTLSDNWGYLYAAYLTQAMIEEASPAGSSEAARRYRSAAETGLASAAGLELHPWQGVEPDGYADTIESALYLLNRLPSAAAAAWVDRQAGTLFGVQAADGRVEDRYLDGNFVRTALLYAAWQSQGVRMAPWDPAAMLGAAPDGDCLTLAIGTSSRWSGRLIFDTPRHRLHLGLPMNYPRLNEWPEWFVVEPHGEYDVEDSLDEVTGSQVGSALADGLQLQLAPGSERRLRVCPASS